MEYIKNHDKYLDPPDDCDFFDDEPVKEDIYGWCADCGGRFKFSDMDEIDLQWYCHNCDPDKVSLAEELNALKELYRWKSPQKDLPYLPMPILVQYYSGAIGIVPYADHLATPVFHLLGVQLWKYIILPEEKQ